MGDSWPVSLGYSFNSELHLKKKPQTSGVQERICRCWGSSFRTRPAARRLVLCCSCVPGGRRSGCSIRCSLGLVCCTSSTLSCLQPEPRCSRRTAHPEVDCHSLGERCCRTWPPAPVVFEGSGTEVQAPGRLHTWWRCQFGEFPPLSVRQPSCL